MYKARGNGKVYNLFISYHLIGDDSNSTFDLPKTISIICLLVYIIIIKIINKASVSIQFMTRPKKHRQQQPCHLARQKSKDLFRNKFFQNISLTVRVTLNSYYTIIKSQRIQVGFCNKPVDCVFALVTTQRCYITKLILNLNFL